MIVSRALTSDIIQEVPENRRFGLPSRFWFMLGFVLVFFLVASGVAQWVYSQAADFRPPVRPGPYSDWKLALARVVPWIAWIPLGALVLRISFILDRSDLKLWTLAVIHGVASFVVATVHIMLTVATNFMLLETAFDSRLFLFRVFNWFQLFDWEVLLYWCILGVGHTYTFWKRARERELRSAQLEAQLNAERLQTLLLQLNPHFLFNTLNAIAGLVKSGKHDAAVTTLARLGALLRTMLESSSIPESTLQHEMEFLERYVDIESVRFGERLHVSTDIDDGALSALVPTLVLQPLVENAIRHGIGSHTGAGVVNVSVRRVGAALRLTVDNTMGMSDPGRTPVRNGGVGLANTRERLIRLYGQDAHLMVDRSSPPGFTVTIDLPYHLTPA
jgi:two-component system, LytTR family, sensor kinase